MSLGHVAAMGRYEALQNPPRDAEAIARDRVPEVVRRLKLVLPDVPELDLEGLATLLGAAVIGGRDYAVKALIKNQWGTLTKSELHSWWKAHLAATNRDIGQTYLSSVPALVEAFVQGLGVPAGNRLLLHYSADDIAEIPQIANLAHLTVGQYLTEVLSFTADKLTAGVLAHRDETVGESSVIGAHGVGGDTGQQDAPPVGVLELRNIQEYWPGGSWAEVDRLRPYLDLAYTGARKREG